MLPCQNGLSLHNCLVWVLIPFFNKPPPIQFKSSSVTSHLLVSPSFNIGFFSFNTTPLSACPSIPCKPQLPASKIGFGLEGPTQISRRKKAWLKQNITEKQTKETTQKKRQMQ